MPNYKLYVIDEDGRSASWTHISDANGHRGLLPCMYFPSNKNSVIVIEHKTQTTHLYIDKDGMMEIEVVPHD